MIVHIHICKEFKSNQLTLFAFLDCGEVHRNSADFNRNIIAFYRFISCGRVCPQPSSKLGVIGFKEQWNPADS